jgi:bifunctional non-homologous end joining protein LigD
MLPNLKDIGLMLATSSKPFSRAGWIYELKYDGARLLIKKQGDDVQLMTRNRKDATSWFPELIPEIKKLKGDFIIDAEVCVTDELGRSDFEALLGLLRPAGRRRKPASLALYCFDLLFLGNQDLRQKPLLYRKEKLAKLIGRGQGRLLFVQHIEEKGEWLYEQAQQMGLEGIVAKKADSRYIAGRTSNWLKSKPAGYHAGGFRRLNRGVNSNHPALKRK